MRKKREEGRRRGGEKKGGSSREKEREKEGYSFFPHKRIHDTFEQHSPTKQPTFAKCLHLPFPGCL